MFFAYNNEDPFAQVRFFTWPSTFWCFHGGQFFLFFHVIHLYIKTLVFRYDLLIYILVLLLIRFGVFFSVSNSMVKKKKERKEKMVGWCSFSFSFFEIIMLLVERMEVPSLCIRCSESNSPVVFLGVFIFHNLTVFEVDILFLVGILGF